jgi:hypothetical protein
VVDVTGCGNAFCGAFLASYAAGQGLLQAGLWGCAAASVIAEQQGVPTLPLLQYRQTALQRLEARRPRVRPGRAPGAGGAGAAGASAGGGAAAVGAVASADRGSRTGSGGGGASRRLVLPLRGCISGRGRRPVAAAGAGRRHAGARFGTL